jgi:hypothetical protein
MSLNDTISATLDSIFDGYEARQTQAMERVSQEILAKIHAGDFQISWDRVRHMHPMIHVLIDIANEDVHFVSAADGFALGAEEPGGRASTPSLGEPSARRGQAAPRSESTHEAGEGAWVQRDVTLVLSGANAVFLKAVVDKLAPTLTALLAACEAKARRGEDVRRGELEYVRRGQSSRERMSYRFTEAEIDWLRRGCFGDTVAALQIVCKTLCPERVAVYRRDDHVAVELTRSYGQVCD